MGIPVLLVLLALLVGVVFAQMAFTMTPERHKSKDQFAAVRNAGVTFSMVVTLELVALGFLWTANTFGQPKTDATPPETSTSPSPSAAPPPDPGMVRKNSIPASPPQVVCSNVSQSAPCRPGAVGVGP